MGKVVRTETTVKEIDAQGDVVREVTTIVQIEQPSADEQPPYGMYL